MISRARAARTRQGGTEAVRLLCSPNAHRRERAARWSLVLAQRPHGNDRMPYTKGGARRSAHVRDQSGYPLKRTHEQAWRDHKKRAVGDQSASIPGWSQASLEGLSKYGMVHGRSRSDTGVIPESVARASLEGPYYGGAPWVKDASRRTRGWAGVKGSPRVWLGKNDARSRRPISPHPRGK